MDLVLLLKAAGVGSGSVLVLVVSCLSQSGSSLEWAAAQVALDDDMLTTALPPSTSSPPAASSSCSNMHMGGVLSVSPPMAISSA